MPIFTVCQGLIASGKSTWAREQLAEIPGTKIINKDLLRTMLDADVHSKSNEKFIIEARDNLIRLAMERGNNIISDDTNLHPKHLDQFQKLVDEFNEKVAPDPKKMYTLVVKFFEISVDEAIQRDLRREKPVGAAAIKGMYKQFLAPKYQYKSFYTNAHPDKEHAWIFDIDGTLAHGEKYRGPYEADKYHMDEPDEIIRELANLLHTTLNDAVIITTGRDERYREVTEKWLAEHDIAFRELFMRPAKDIRADDIIKEEILNNKILPHYSIKGVFDDRRRVVNMWRRNGLLVLHVAEGDF